jgi:hypothetical protein
MLRAKLGRGEDVRIGKTTLKGEKVEKAKTRQIGKRAA